MKKTFYSLSLFILLTEPTSSAYGCCLNFVNKSNIGFVIEEAILNVSEKNSVVISGHGYPTVSPSSYKTKRHRITPGQAIKNCVKISTSPTDKSSPPQCQMTELKITFFDKAGNTKTDKVNLKQANTKFEANETLNITFSGTGNSGVINVNDSKGTFAKINTS
jgi:hypothetical protein